MICLFVSCRIVLDRETRLRARIVVCPRKCPHMCTMNAELRLHVLTPPFQKSRTSLLKLLHKKVATNSRGGVAGMVHAFRQFKKKTEVGAAAFSTARRQSTRNFTPSPIIVIVRVCALLRGTPPGEISSTRRNLK